MARYLYISIAPDAQDRATVLGCGLLRSVPPEFASIAAAPCVILNGGNNETVVIPDNPPTTADAVAAAAQPILDAEAANQAAQIGANSNLASLESKATAAIATNITALGLPDPTAANQAYIASSPTTAQVAAQVKALTAQVDALVAQVQALTRQNTALIRLALGILDSTAGT